ncbi:hypothetical protein ACFWXK_25020 [Streptomyces sp. NPDC059070]|uniref:hypothetical protein n=1 Tax=Streptomyces sp. NPDC059070 TaxID=3346713 RepID=UPI00367C3233
MALARCSLAVFDPTLLITTHFDVTCFRGMDVEVSHLKKCRGAASACPILSEAKATTPVAGINAMRVTRFHLADEFFLSTKILTSDIKNLPKNPAPARS